MIWQLPPAIAAFPSMVGRDGQIVVIEIFARPSAAMLALRGRMNLHIQTDPVAACLMGLAA